ncbi:hypothetical protein E2C01_060400 [Portunus trituberculatus]|uniref:Uncharacterized protein n=1 Tax=Portunus trituberculatus TaxID=210409 RepID=A0A5B7H7Y0_PORTR|nr:hypothetical protein [Portunus trituberculatus]
MRKAVHPIKLKYATCPEETRPVLSTSIHTELRHEHIHVYISRQNVSGGVGGGVRRKSVGGRDDLGSEWGAGQPATCSSRRMCQAYLFMVESDQWLTDDIVGRVRHLCQRHCSSAAVLVKDRAKSRRHYVWRPNKRGHCPRKVMTANEAPLTLRHGSRHLPRPAATSLVLPRGRIVSGKTLTP